MVKNSPPKDYLHNSNVLVEIVKSQAIQAKYPEEERNERAAECLTSELVRMLMLLVKNIASSYRWRGYTWNEDMQAEALLSLCRVALKFNLEKATANGNPANPFGYYTQIISRVFLTYVDKEKKQGRIKDEIIEMSDTDLLPSFSRQFEDGTHNSLHTELDGTKSIPSDPKRRKRKKKGKRDKETANLTDTQYQRWLDAKVQEFLEKGVEVITDEVDESEVV